MKQRIVLLGPPASGKGTQAELMLARFQIPIASPGAILRDERRLCTSLGLKTDEMTGKGQLVSDSIVNEVVEQWLEHHENVFVFDGYPRSLGQACALDEMLRERCAPLDVVLSLEADTETIRDRVARRMMCAACGRIVSIGLHVANAESMCPACGGELIRRSDDNSETLEMRLREYADKTAPLIDYYSMRGLLRAVSSAGTPEVVFSSRTTILEGR